MFPVFNEGDRKSIDTYLNLGVNCDRESPPTAKANLPHPAVPVGVLRTEIYADPQPRCLASYVRNVVTVLVAAA